MNFKLTLLQSISTRFLWVVIFFMFSTFPLLYAQTTTDSSTSVDAESTSVEDEGLDTETLQRLFYQKPKLVKGLDFMFSTTVGIGIQGTNKGSTLENELAGLRPSGTPAAADDDYSAISGSSTLPYFLSVDAHLYHKWFGGGISYHRLTYTSRTQYSGVEIANSSNSNTLTNRITESPVWSFDRYAHTYSYNYSLSSDAVSLEFHIRHNFITDRVKVLFGLGYLYQDALFNYELISVDENNRSVKQMDTKFDSHGFVMRFEMNFTINYFLIRTGVLVFYNNFPTPYIENIPVDIPNFTAGPYISLGASF